MSFIYLASPYSHPSKDVRQFRMMAAAHESAKLTARATVYCPVLHGHHLDMFGMQAVQTHKFWMDQCFGMLEKAYELHVLCLDGWDESKGVAREIRYAVENKMPVFYIDVS